MAYSLFCIPQEGPAYLLADEDDPRRTEMFLRRDLAEEVAAALRGLGQVSSVWVLPVKQVPAMAPVSGA